MSRPGLAAACLLAAAHGLAGSAGAGEPSVRVAVTVLPQTEVVQRVGGDFVEVLTLVPPGAFPDTFELTPKQMAKLAEADLWLRVGIPFENVLVNRVGSLAPRLVVVDGFAGIDRQPMDGGDHVGHDHGALDPHIWLDPMLVAKHAALLAEGLCRLAPSRCTTFEANLAGYRSDLERLDARVAAALGSRRGSPMFVFHPAYGYFARRYGLVQVPVEVSGKVPTGRRLASLVELARDAGARALFVQPQYAGGGAEAAAAALQVEVVELDPLAPDLAANLEHMADVIARSLGGRR